MQEQLKKAEERMNRRLDHMCQDFSEIRAGRANPAVLDKIKVDYYGTPTPVNQLAAVSVTEARTLTIQPWDASVLKQVEKAIQTSDIGINPQNDGKIIRLIFPPLTEDRRKEIVKDVQKIAEETKVQIRNVRRDTIEKLKAMKKTGDLTEDDLKLGEKKTQDLTDKFVKNIDKISADKQKEILEM
ncbi:MAG: ribosome recycling factor [Ruminococcus bromii]|jgi:ribosome recycling factor|uniref:ribosome recycling factor n=1 Tax=Ruminococcus sp. YE282 TaxID=3158780 RepID=UPI00088D3523|nr:ribosome recycling factor [Ruminococcus bromii]MCI7210866.1 ribosome recycling factor [Ruminococcus bromii]MDD6433121.1 ribosome recycling factor [Ruminococcus bromii]MDY4084919.1 ribosome recycling factor [Ruminococcus bromii]MDY4711362.1 ribosome recycling factor [Ruminococcus bromii]